MKKKFVIETNYARIAENYDKNPLRQKAIDSFIPEIISSHNNNEKIRILDIACGTGNYLTKQYENFCGYNIEFFGIDKSYEMIAVAKKKNGDITYLQNNAEDQVFRNDYFNYIRNEYSFHHFLDKKNVLLTINRILKQNGLFVILNICPDYIKRNWLYEYFPSSKGIDNKRFIPSMGLFLLLDQCNFEAVMKITTSVARLNFTNAIRRVKNRDMSQLNLISEEEYQTGLNRLILDQENKVEYIYDVSILMARCRKKKE